MANLPSQPSHAPFLPHGSAILWDLRRQWIRTFLLTFCLSAGLPWRCLILLISSQMTNNPSWLCAAVYKCGSWTDQYRWLQRVSSAHVNGWSKTLWTARLRFSSLIHVETGTQRHRGLYNFFLQRSSTLFHLGKLPGLFKTTLNGFVAEATLTTNPAEPQGQQKEQLFQGY